MIERTPIMIERTMSMLLEPNNRPQPPPLAPTPGGGNPPNPPVEEEPRRSPVKDMDFFEPLDEIEGIDGALKALLAYLRPFSSKLLLFFKKCEFWEW